MNKEITIRPLGFPIWIRGGQWGLWASIQPAIWLKLNPQVLVGIEWKLADLWVGMFLKWRDFATLDIWICLLPCIPIHIIWTRREEGK